MKSLKLRNIVIIAIVVVLAVTIGAFRPDSRKILEQEVPKEIKIPIEVKISQMIVIGYDGSDKALENLKSSIVNNSVSGVIFYKRNIKNPVQIKKQISQFNELSKSEHPLFMMIDQEGGQVSRIAYDNGFKTFPAAQTVSTDLSKQAAYNTYYEMALNLKNIGINFNLAPCVDVKTNAKSSIGSNLRIYGSKPEIVTEYSLEFINAHNDAKVITAIKHFPGLGNAQFDTHKLLPDITNTWKETELIPFKNIIKKYPKEPVLVGHVMNKNIDSENVSSFSYKTISLLTDNMKHQGVVLADAVDMSAIDNYDIDEILIKSINSGVNLFIFPNHVQNTDNSKVYMEPEYFIQIIKEAVALGKINQEKVDDSYNKIIDLKRRFIINEAAE